MRSICYMFFRHLESKCGDILSLIGFQAAWLKPLLLSSLFPSIDWAAHDYHLFHYFSVRFPEILHSISHTSGTVQELQLFLTTLRSVYCVSVHFKYKRYHSNTAFLQEPLHIVASLSFPCILSYSYYSFRHGPKVRLWHFPNLNTYKAANRSSCHWALLGKTPAAALVHSTWET